MRDYLPHIPVLYHEIIHALQPQRGGQYVDCTIGAGGHAWGILESSSPDGRLLGMDVDPQAIDIARARLSEFGARVHLIQASYTTLPEQLASLGWSKVGGILLDLGLSSIQMDTPGRGFSIQSDGPLDMRFDPNLPTSAEDLVNSLPEMELAELLYKYGEERQARQIARAIVLARPLYTTHQLAKVVMFATGRNKGTPSPRGRIHPATRTFQALRIAVNHELDNLEVVLPQAVLSLALRGRLAVVSFHSLEDRLVKRYFRRESQDCICPPRQPVCTCGHRATLTVITSTPIRPSEVEVQKNPRARSARLRIAEKI